MYRVLMPIVEFEMRPLLGPVLILKTDILKADGQRIIVK